MSAVTKLNTHFSFPVALGAPSSNIRLRMSHMLELSLSSSIELNTGHCMPRLGFGVYQNYVATETSLEAFKAGYRHVDSAQAYRNEAAVGKAIAESGIPREKLFITTKIISKNHGYQKTLDGVKLSLEKFNLDYIDLFLIHDPFAGREKRLETYKALAECKKAGLIRSAGVSNYGVKHLEEIEEAGMETPAVNQIELHPFCQQKPIVEYCKQRSIVVQAYCPLVRGEKMDNEGIQKISTKHNKEPAQILLRWSLQKGFVPLPKSVTVSRIHSNTELYDFHLEDEDMASLDALDQGKGGAISWNPVDAS